MAGSPMKNVRERHDRLVREAIVDGWDREGGPERCMKVYTDELKKMAVELPIESPVKLSALKEIFDRVDGKVAQEIVGDGLIAPTLIIEVLEARAERLEKVIQSDPAGLIEGSE